MTDCLLYMISPPSIPDLGAFTQQCRAAFEAGGEHIGAFQLRLKADMPAPDALTQASAHEDVICRVSGALLPLCKEYGVPFMMNDKPALARKVGADGVHLGQEDGTVADARSVLGDEAVIGVSCHASKHLAMQAGEDGADYVAFGAFYPTRSKSAKALEHWGTPEPEILTWWTQHAVLPCVAIGGINEDNADLLIEAGADFVAVISSIWQHPKGVAHAVQTLCEKF